MRIDELSPASYNPREITDDGLSGLRKALYVFGDLSGITFNEKTGNLICAHQRKKALQQLRSQWAQRGFFGLLAVERLSGED